MNFRRQTAAAVAAVALCTVAGAALAQAHGPSDPRGLPGDTIPPVLTLDDQGKLRPFPTGAAYDAFVRSIPPRGTIESTAIGPDAATAMRIAQAAMEQCRSEGFRVGVSVIDTEGYVHAMLAADGAAGSRVFHAYRKALVVLGYGKSSGEVSQGLQAGTLSLDRVTPAMFLVPGALPIMRQGKLIGAVGVSGAAAVPIGEHDAACAQAGLDAVADRLK